MECKIYAPVIIPTLNRFEHFKRCLESIELCTGAEYTEVYVGLDYPPSEKYMEGWERIDKYLIEKEKDNKFKRLVVFRREHNCGISGIESNANLLIREVSAKYDRYIFSEDDNEFSPNFLEYMNKGFEKYKDDERVIKISAYTPPAYGNLTKNTTFFGIDTPGYGLGTWANKNPAVDFSNELITLELKRSILHATKLFLRWPALVNSAVHMVKCNKGYGDIRYSIYNLIKGTFTLHPTISLCRNWGADGSGIHSGKVEGIEKIEIQTKSMFEMEDIPFEYPQNLEKKMFRYNMPNGIIFFLLHFCYAYIYLLRFIFTRK